MTHAAKGDGVSLSGAWGECSNKVLKNAKKIKKKIKKKKKAMMSSGNGPLYVSFLLIRKSIVQVSMYVSAG